MGKNLFPEEFHETSGNVLTDREVLQQDSSYYLAQLLIIDPPLEPNGTFKSKQAAGRLMEAAWIIHARLGVSLQCPVTAVGARAHTSN